MQEQVKTVQAVPDRLFVALSHYSFGEAFKTKVNGFPNLTLIQPIKIDSQSLAIGIHHDHQVAHFFLFKEPEAYKEQTSENLRVFTVFAGKISGFGPTAVFKNRIYYDNIGKVDQQQNYLHASRIIIDELDVILRNWNLTGAELVAEIPIQEVPTLELISETDEKTLLCV